LAFRQRSRQRKPGDAHTILSFCESNAISESKYYDLKRKKKGPREIEIGGRVIITPEAELDWRREREAETAAKRQERAAA
jgi:predicted DNA-binding transcriptional regulator AlpA